MNKFVFVLKRKCKNVHCKVGVGKIKTKTFFFHLFKEALVKKVVPCASLFSYLSISSRFTW